MKIYISKYLHINISGPIAGVDYTDCLLDGLTLGWNAGKMVTALIMAIPYTERPIHLVVADRQGTFFAMSIFNMQEGKLKPGDYITALSPYLRYCSLPPAVLDAGKRERDRETATERQRDSDSSLLEGAETERREGKSGYVCVWGGGEGC